jgi:hypothetical protein
MISSPARPQLPSEPAPTGIFPTAVPPQRLASLVRLHGILLVVLAVLSPFFFWSVLKGLPNYLEADHRLAPTFAMIHGYQVYYPPDAGPALSTLYGPVTFLTYLPVTFASTPTAAILIGTLLTLTIFFLATTLVIRTAAGATWMKWWQLFGLTVGVVWLIEPVERTSAQLHADAPALACAALAALFAMRRRYGSAAWENAALSGLFGMLSVFAKQNMVPLLLGLAIWFSIRERWKGLSIFVVSVAAFSALMIVITATLLGGASAFYFNCVYMPLHQPFDKALLFPTIAQLTVISLALLLIPMARILQSWSQSDDCLREFLIVQRTPLLVLIGILMVPAAIMGRLKLAGGENSLGLSLFFFVLALLAETSAHRVGRFADLLSANEIKLWSLPLLIACIVGMGSAVYKSLTPRLTSPIRQAFDYSRRHPGKVYFPQFPLAQLMAEGELYHFSWGLTDRRNAGVPVSNAHFLANIPPTAKVIAVTGFVPQFETDMTSRQGPQITHFEDASQLPQFEFFQIRRSASK